jgi:hypothetical protein
MPDKLMLMPKRIITGVVVLLCIAVAYLLWPSDAKRIKKIIHHTREAALRKDLQETMKPVSFNYKDRYGFSYLYLKRYLKRLFQDVEHFEIEVSRIKVKVKDKEAEAHFLARVKALETGQSYYIIGDEDVAESVILRFQREHLKWKVIETYLPMREGLL